LRDRPLATLQLTAWAATMSVGSWGSLVVGVATAMPLISSAQAWWQERAARDRASVDALVTSLEKEREALSAAQRDNRELTAASMAENRAWIASDRRSFEERQSAALAAAASAQSAALAAATSAQSAALAAAASENRAALADDRRAFDQKLSSLVQSQAKSWWKS